MQGCALLDIIDTTHHLGVKSLKKTPKEGHE